MEDARSKTPVCPSFAARSWSVVGGGLCLSLAIAGLAGCSLFVMAGKMFFGDPVMPAPFAQATGVDLTEAGKNVIVLCSAPSMMEDGDVSFNYEIVENVSRRLKREGVPLIDSNDVRTWMDDHGGRLDDPRELAEDFNVDYILYVSLARVSFREENSPNLYRGVASGEVFGYQVLKENGETVVHEVFSKGFSITFPEFHPVSADQVDSPRIFQNRFLERVAAHVSHLFYSHKASEEIR